MPGRPPNERRLSLEQQQLVNLEPKAIAEAVRLATESVFSMMVAIPVEAGEFRLDAEPEPIHGVVALLSFSGPWIGGGMVVCTDQFACRIGSAMLMSEISEINGDILDGLGEVGNMVLGNFKENLEAQIGALSLSIPTVLYGKNFTARSPVKAPWVVVPFTAEGAAFDVRVCIQERS
jgi:CheY-specific phosphatase CheX